MRVKIRAMAHGGAGVGDPEGGGPTWFVAGALPGETVIAEPEHTAARWIRGRLTQVEEAADIRVTPPCPLAEVCGGCAWQFVAPAAQLALKVEIVASQLRGLVDPTRIDAPPVPGAAALGYRRRARLHYERTAEGLALGFHRARSHDIVDAPRCPVLDAPLRHAMDRLRMVADVLPAKGEVHGLSDGKFAALGLPGVRPDAAVLERLRSALDDRLLGIMVRGGRKTGSVGQPRLAIDAAAGLPPVTAHPFSFAQANAMVNRALVRYVAQRAKADGLRVLELYSGAGNFTRALAKTAHRVWAVDDDPDAITALHHDIERHGLPINAKKSSVPNLVPRIAAGDVRYEVVVIDPPREGLGAAASAAVARVATERVVMVSCDPATLRRDLEAMVKSGLAITHVAVFDMMPMTPEVEVVVTLEHGR